MKSASTSSPSFIPTNPHTLHHQSQSTIVPSTSTFMGLIKTAMMSGAAMYGIKQIANTAQQRRHDDSPRHYDMPSTRREQPDQGYYVGHPQPLEFRTPQPGSEYPSSRTASERSDYRNNEAGQRLYLIDDQAPVYDQPYYTQVAYNTSRQREYARTMRSPSAPPVADGWSGEQRRRQQGFVESDEDTVNDPRGSMGGSRADMFGSPAPLAQQALGVDFMSDRRGAKDKNSGKRDKVEDLLKTLTRR